MQPGPPGPARGQPKPGSGWARQVPGALLLAIALLALYLTLSVLSMRVKVATYDEVSHLPSGYTHLAWGDYRFNPEHPPLVKMLAAVPLLASGAKAPSTPTSGKAWQLGLTEPDAQWAFGREFLYATPGNDADRLLFRGRLMVLALALLLGVLLWAWAREMFGAVTAAGVLALYALDPNMLAHGHLVTTDLALACFMFGTVYFLWRSTRCLTLANVTSSTLFLALAFASKYSAVLLLPIVAGLALVPIMTGEPWQARTWGKRWLIGSRWARAGIAVGLLVFMTLTAWASVWAVYRFRHTPTPDPASHFPVRTVVEQAAQETPLVAKVLSWADEKRLLPEAYSFGFLYANVKAAARSSYLMGILSTKGWWYYFPVAMAIKTPSPTLLTLAAALTLIGSGVWKRLRQGVRVDARRQGVTGWKEHLFVLIPVVVYLGVALRSNLNIGLRHILPVYPFLFLFCGHAISSWVTSRKWGWRVVGIVLAAWLGWSSLSIHPHYLAYFNELAGGPKNGVRWLADSNLDWGQDLKLLKQWLDRKGINQVNLSYFGTADPDYYGIRYVNLPGGTSFTQRDSPPVLPGYVAISATNLTGVYFSPRLREDYTRLLRKATLVDTVGYSIYVYYLR